jgi:hypothetical protein
MRIAGRPTFAITRVLRFAATANGIRDGNSDDRSQRDAGHAIG